MFEDIQKHRQAVAENIEKSFQIGFTESEDLQKAHNVGDVHPNGKWVWTQLPSGKYDWRVIKKTAQSNSQKAIPKKNGIELTSKGIKEYINKNSATRDERMKAMAEVYKALKDSGKNKKVDTFVKEVSSGSPSVDMTTRKYVEAINDGATHDEAVAFADKCYKEFTTNLNKFQEKVYSEGVSPSTAAKMFASATEWFKAQKFEKKANYGKVVQEEEDFESFADRYEKEYRKNHSGSPVKNSEIRYEASKEWDKMHSSENCRSHHVGQKYGGAKER